MKKGYPSKHMDYNYLANLPVDYQTSETWVEEFDEEEV